MPACLSLALADLMNRAQCKSEDLRSGILSLLDIVPGTNCHSQEGAFQLSLTPRSYPVGDTKNNDLG
jgi:hypothetical protein